MMTPIFPEWGGELDHFYSWHMYTGPSGDMHAGHLLDTVIGIDVDTGKQRVYEILRCEPCIAIHATPLPSKEGLKRYYAEKFYQVSKPDMVERYNRDRFWWQHCTYNPLFKHCLQYRPQAKRVLDAGAGTGICLDTARDHGLSTYGIEPNADQCEALRTRGHTMFCGTLDDVHTGGGVVGFSDFDIIVTYETLEHQPEPENFLLQCYDFLVPGGILVVCVPNDCSPVQYAACRALGIQPWWYAVPQHLFFWTPKMLQLQIRRCGFEILDMRGTYPIDKYLLSGENYIGNDALGKKVHARRMQEELFVWQSGLWSAREEQYRRNLADKRLGREILCFAKKQ